jgi:hypothetical protein
METKPHEIFIDLTIENLEMVDLIDLSDVDEVTILMEMRLCHAPHW